MKYNNKVNLILRNRGLSLVEILMSLAVLGIIVSGMMSMTKNQVDRQTNTDSNFDYVQLQTEFSTILSRDYNCKAALVNPDEDGNLTGAEIRFRASDLQMGSDPAGHPQISLYVATSDGFRKNVRLAQNQKYGNITITSIKLHMPDHNTGDMTEGGELPAEIVLEGVKRNTTTDVVPIQPLKRLIYISTLYDSGTNESQIEDCYSGGGL